MRSNKLISISLGMTLAAVCAAVPSAAQETYPQQSPPQYPPAQQYPPQQGQYPPEGQYPPQGQYPPPQGQYPPAEGQYPPPQGQYPQPQYAQPPMLSPQQLDQLVGPIALYPDGLLAQTLTAATFSNEIPDAAGWANAHSYLKAEALADAIRQDNLPWDPSILALLPFPSVLNYMAQNMGWTQALGNAVLAQRPEVMDAVQRLRQEAYNYGYLRDSQYNRVIYAGPGNIEIVPVTPGYYYVPYYNPAIVFYRPRPGFFVGGAIRFGPGISIGAAFSPWGWRSIGFGWPTHSIIIDNRPWVRTWSNRATYAYPYPYRRPEGGSVERHELPPAHHDAHEDHHEHGEHGEHAEHR